jgi:Leucine-rich repeat (LRR) protein
MRADGSDVRQLTHNEVGDSSPAYSPDGEWLAFHSDRDGDYEIYVMRADGSDVRQLTHNEVVDVGPTWSPDGTLIAFTAGEDYKSYGIYAVSAAGSPPVEVIDHGGAESSPSWSAVGIDGFDPVIEQAFFADEALQRVVRQAVGKTSMQALDESDLLRVRSLEAHNAGIADLGGMEQLRGLEKLDLSNWSIIKEVDGRWMIDSSHVAFPFEQWNQVRDLSPLAGLVKLKELNLSLNPVEDLSPLSGLSQLTELSLGNVLAADVSPLSGLTRLTELSLGSEQIEDISPLASLTGLEELSLQNGRFEDLSPLSGMSRLILLSIGGTRVWDLSPLSGLDKVSVMNLVNNRIEDVGPLARMNGLVRLELGGNQIRDIAPLLELQNVTSIGLKDNPLDETARQVDIPALQARGVRVEYD